MYRTRGDFRRLELRLLAIGAHRLHVIDHQIHWRDIAIPDFLAGLVEDQMGAATQLKNREGLLFVFEDMPQAQNLHEGAGLGNILHME